MPAKHFSVFVLIAVAGCPAPPEGIGTPQALTCDWTDRDISADVPDAAALADLAPGTLIAAQHISHIDAFTLGLKASISVGYGAEVYRAAYVSVDRGDKVVVTARIAVPDSGGPGAVSGIVGHQHGTFGFGDDCAPSALSDFGFESEVNPNAAWALTQNLAVVMTDYIGLGAPGLHPYVVRVPSGQAVLDGLTALQGFCDDARGVSAPGEVPIVLEGHSQGAHATVSALTLPRGNNLDIRAAVAIALPTEHGLLATRMMTEGDVEPALIVMGMLGQINHRPEVFGDYADWFVPDVVEWLNDRGDVACAPEMSLRFARTPDALFVPDVLDAFEDGDFAALGVEGAIAEERFTTIDANVPLLVLHGEDDELIPVDIVEDAAEMWTLGDADVTVDIVEGGHATLPSQVREQVFTFLTDHGAF